MALRERGHPFVQHLALPAGHPAEAARRDPGGAVERAHEVGDVAETDLERDLSDRARVVRWTFSRITQDSLLWQGHILEPDGITWRL